MPVVINNFEVVPEQPSGPRSAQGEAPSPAETGGGTQAAPAPAALTPKDVERILRRRAERLSRIAAH